MKRVMNFSKKKIRTAREDHWTASPYFIKISYHYHAAIMTVTVSTPPAQQRFKQAAPATHNNARY